MSTVQERTVGKVQQGGLATELKGLKTEKNLLTAFAGESQARNQYTYFSSQARKEGFNDIATVFKAIAVAEKQHERRYLGLLRNVQEGRVFRRDEVVKWRCRNCGYIHEGKEAPEKCPACDHPRAHYELLAENWQE